MSTKRKPLSTTARNARLAAEISDTLCSLAIELKKLTEQVEQMWHGLRWWEFNPNSKEEDTEDVD